MGPLIQSACMRTEKITYMGIVFTRYPDSKRRQHRMYYWPTKTQRERGVGALHVEMWKNECGPIPDGYVIHHLNHDSTDNRIENFACITKAEHQDEHPVRGRQDAEHMSKIRELAVEWHGSDEGLAWHRAHGAETWANRTEREVGPCAGCGKQVVSKIEKYGDHDQRWHRQCYINAAGKKYWRDATCPVCGSEFKQQKIGKPKTCSRSCGASMRHQQVGR